MAAAGRLSEEQYRCYGKEILKGFLFLACHYEADDVAFLGENRITHVINVAEECEPQAETRKLCKVMHLQLKDSPRTDLSQHFEGVFAFIKSAESAKGRCLVHCFEGRNRSAAFVIGYLMRAGGLTFAEAFLKAKRARPLVDPNVGFRKQLRDLEIAVRGSGPPSLPMTQDEIEALLDLELVKPADVGRYTDLPFVTYEGFGIKVEVLSSPARVRGVRGASPTPKTSRAPAKKHRRHSSVGLTAAKAKAKPGADASGGRPVAVAATVGGRRPSSPAPAPVAAEPLPLEEGPRGPLADVAALLFDALDVSVRFFLGPPELERAAELLASVMPARAIAPAVRVAHSAVALRRELAGGRAVGDDVCAAELFRRMDLNSDGTVSRAEMSSTLVELTGSVVDGSATDAILCSADRKSRGRLLFPEFLEWVRGGGKFAEALCELVCRHSFVHRVLAALSGPDGPGDGVVKDIEALARGLTPCIKPGVAASDAERARLSPVVENCLFLTNWRGAADPEAIVSSHVTHIVSVGTEFEGDEPHAEAGVKYLHVTVDDDEQQEAVMRDSLEQGVDFIDSAIEAGGCVVVHCAAGIWRSSTLVLAYLVSRRHLSLLAALQRLLLVRPCVWPNVGFTKALVAWEEQHRFGRATIRPEQHALWSYYDADAYAVASVADRDP